MNRSNEIGSLAAALSKAQGEIHGAKKDEANPFYKSRYADLASVWDACRTALSKHGIAVVQLTGYDSKDQFTLFTTVTHSSGEWMQGLYPIQPVKPDPQGFGSAITYARRYALAAAVGVYQIDDDGNDASRTSRPIIAKDMQPGLDDGIQETGVRIPYGPLANQFVHNAKPESLRAYVQSIEMKAKEMGKPVPKWAEPVIAAAEPIIGAYENSTDFKAFKGSNIHAPDNTGN